MQQGQKWIVTADSRRASLYECRRSEQGELVVAHLASLENQHEGEHEHGRPILAGGGERRGAVTRSGARAGPQAVSGGHGPEEEDRRFAREVVAWLAHARQSSDQHRVTVFAPPGFLGVLRPELAQDNLTRLCEGELTRLRPHELAGHPAVRSAVLGI